MDNPAQAAQLDRLRSTIGDIIARYVPIGERGETLIPGLAVGHITRPMPARTYIYEPSLCICIRGLKRVSLGEQRFTYDPHHLLLTSIGLPAIVEVSAASPETPYVALQLNLDLDMARRLIADMETGGAETNSTAPGFVIAPLPVELLDAVARLVTLLDTPGDIPILADLVHREILYRLLRGPAAARLRQTVRIGSQSNRVAGVVSWLRANYARQFRIEELAESSGMGVSTLHRHFHALTTMSPIQYQKLLRLHEARRLMLSEDFDAAGAAYEVGYESVTQFSREYSRLFGAPPRRDVSAIMRTGLSPATP